MSRSWDEKDMPRIADAYDDLEEKVLDEKYEIEEALREVVGKYQLTDREQSRLLGWLNDAIADQEGDAAGQERLDADH